MVAHGAHEDVDTAGGALGVRRRRQILRELQPLLERHEIDAARLKHRAIGEIKRMHQQRPIKAVSDARLARQEGCAQAIGDLSESQVERGGLDLVGEHATLGGDDAFLDQRLQLAVRQDAGTVETARHRPPLTALQGE
jgi:hypothetical protein